MRQTDVIYESEGDAWFQRNCTRLGKTRDRVTEIVDELGIRPATALEIGCSNGWRLAKWHRLYGANAIGIEPSSEAVRNGRSLGRAIRRGTADSLWLSSAWANVLVYGFCLYLTDPEDWLKIAAEGDRVLMLGGHLIIHDFAGSDRIEIRPYIHDERLVSHHYDFARLWLGHPRYSLVRRAVFDEDQGAVTVLKKNGLRAEFSA